MKKYFLPVLLNTVMFCFYINTASACNAVFLGMTYDQTVKKLHEKGEKGYEAYKGADEEYGTSYDFPNSEKTNFTLTFKNDHLIEIVNMSYGNDNVPCLKEAVPQLGMAYYQVNEIFKSEGVLQITTYQWDVIGLGKVDIVMDQNKVDSISLDDTTDFLS